MLIAQQLLEANIAKRALRGFLDNERNEQAHVNRHIYVKQLQQARVDPCKFPKLALDIKCALQHNPDQRHWSEWDQPRREDDHRPDQHEGLLSIAWAKMESLERAILAAEGMERMKLIYEMKNIRAAIMDQGYITLQPEGYIEYPDGETLGYNELRYLIDILEGEPIEEPYQTPEENHLFRLANAERIYPDFEEQPLDDRGYQPPTFTPSLELSWDNIEKFMIDRDSRVQVVIEDILARDIHLHQLFTGSYLSQAERYFTLKRIVSRAKERFMYLKYHETLERLVELAGLEEFVELYDDELSNRDPGDWYDETNDQDILDMADHVIDQITQAAQISILATDLQKMWQDNRRQFPAPEKVVSWRTNGKVLFRTKDEADYKTLGQLYKLAGLTIDGRLLHGHTAFYQRGVIEKISAGASISDAYRLTREEYLTYRHAHPVAPQTAS